MSWTEPPYVPPFEEGIRFVATQLSRYLATLLQVLFHPVRGPAKAPLLQRPSSDGDTSARVDADVLVFTVLSISLGLALTSPLRRGEPEEGINALVIGTIWVVWIVFGIATHALARAFGLRVKLAVTLTIVFPTFAALYVVSSLVALLWGAAVKVPMISLEIGKLVAPEGLSTRLLLQLMTHPILAYYYAHFILLVMHLPLSLRMLRQVSGPRPTAAADRTMYLPDLQGGWRGMIGLLANQLTFIAVLGLEMLGVSVLAFAMTAVGVVLTLSLFGSLGAGCTPECVHRVFGERFGLGALLAVPVDMVGGRPVVTVGGLLAAAGFAYLVVSSPGEPGGASRARLWAACVLVGTMGLFLLFPRASLIPTGVQAGVRAVLACLTWVAVVLVVFDAASHSWSHRVRRDAFQGGVGAVSHRRTP